MILQGLLKLEKWMQSYKAEVKYSSVSVSLQKFKEFEECGSVHACSVNVIFHTFLKPLHYI